MGDMRIKGALRCWAKCAHWKRTAGTSAAQMRATTRGGRQEARSMASGLGGKDIIEGALQSSQLALLKDRDAACTSRLDVS